MGTSRQHFIYLIERLYRSIRNFLIPFALFVYNELKSNFGNQPTYVYYIASGLGVYICVVAFLKWYKHTYTVSSDKITLAWGVLNTNQMSVPLAKVAGIDVTQTWLHKLVGAYRMSVHTSDEDSSADVVMVVGKQKVNELQNILSGSNFSDLPENEAVKYTQIKATKKDIALFSLTSGSYGVGISMSLAITTFLLNKIPKMLGVESSEEVDKSTTALFKELTTTSLPDVVSLILSLVVLILFSIGLAWLITLVYTQYSYRGWTTTREADSIHIRYGFLDNRHVQLPVNKIQSLRIKRPYLLKKFGYASLLVDTTGYEGTLNKKVLVPIVKEKSLDEVVSILLPEVSDVLNEKVKHPNIVKWYMFFKYRYILVLALVFGAMFWKIKTGYLLVPALAYIMCSIIYNVKKYKESGWTIKDKHIILTTGKVVQTTVYLFRKSVTSLRVYNNLMDTKYGVYELDVEINSPTASREYLVKGLDQQDLRSAQYWYKNS